MQEILQGNAALIEALGALCTRDKAIHHSTDAYGNAFHWFRLDHPRFMSQAATALQGAHARLCMITAYNLKQLGEQQQELCYHFELQGVVYNITVTLTAEHNTVPSITPLFANADWHEREMMELYGIRVANQPNPRQSGHAARQIPVEPGQGRLRHP